MYIVKHMNKKIAAGLEKIYIALHKNQIIIWTVTIVSFEQHFGKTKQSSFIFTEF